MIPLALLAAAVAGFVVSSIVYGLGARADGAAGAPPSRSFPALLVGELLRNALVAGLVVGLLSAIGRNGWLPGLALGAALWTLPVVLLIGSVIHEGAKPGRAALHALDWAVKLVVMSVVVGLII